MKYVAFTFGILISAQGFLAHGAQPKCPPVVEEPKALVCKTRITYAGQKFNKTFKISLKEAGYKQWTGSVDFEFPGVQNGDGQPNTIKTTVWTETHGNSPTCQVQQAFETEIDVLSYKIGNAGRRTSVKIDDGFGFVTFALDMSCAAE